MTWGVAWELCASAQPPVRWPNSQMQRPLRQPPLLRYLPHSKNTAQIDGDFSQVGWLFTSRNTCCLAMVSIAHLGLKCYLLRDPQKQKPFHIPLTGCAGSYPEAPISVLSKSSSLFPTRVKSPRWQSHSHPKLATQMLQRQKGLASACWSMRGRSATETPALWCGPGHCGPLL